MDDFRWPDPDSPPLRHSGEKMLDSLNWSRISQLLRTGGVFRVSDWTLNRIDPDGLRYVATVLVWIHWVVGTTFFVVLVYPPWYGPGRFTASVILFLVMLVCNGCVHYRLASNRRLTWRWIFAMCSLDAVLATTGAALGGGFSHHFFHLLYYPVLAGFAVFFTSFRLNMAFATGVAALYLSMSLTVGGGIDLEARDEKPLVVRILVMYAVAATVNLVSRFERIRWRAAVERERELQRQRIVISQNIHDTTAQWAYMIGLGVEGAMEVADRANKQLMEKLEVAAELSRSAMWELRHPIDGGQIFRGEELQVVLEAHAATFTVIASVPAEFAQRGAEPSLSTITKSLLFSVAHNALTNVMRHAKAGRVFIELDCTGEQLRLSVSDDGIGLPPDYEARGHGFRNMRADAHRMGGYLEVKSEVAGGGTTVTCVVPYHSLTGGK